MRSHVPTIECMTITFIALLIGYVLGGAFLAFYSDPKEGYLTVLITLTLMQIAILLFYYHRRTRS